MINNQSKTKNYPLAIAVVGMGCQYPGARDIRQLWSNILAKRRQFRQIPDVRLPIAEYYNRDRSVPDQTYGDRAAVIDGFEFDWIGRRIPQQTVQTTDIVHWLALETANDALKDAGFTRQNITVAKTGVILGNTLTGEQTRASTLRLRWPYVKRSLVASAKARKMSDRAVEALMSTMEQFYKSVFAPVNEDSLAGGLSNTIAGRICNFFNFDGGGYTVDGACASSLIATATACSKLVNGDLDLALAGGVDVSLDTFELIGFAKTGALTAGDMAVYDRRASGFIPGEGCGFVVLKRLADARAAGDYVYGVIRGWGISSDGKGGITAPSKIGQSKAILRAYEKAGYHPSELDFIEGHGTGTPVGDRVELEGIALAISKGEAQVKPRSVGITSFKSLVGHTKAAAGVGGLIKAVMAVNQRVIPPTTGCTEANPAFATTAQSIYPILTGKVCQPDTILRAGVSAMGFGGINSHLTLESGNRAAEHLKTDLSPKALLVSAQDSELFVLSAVSIEKLLERTEASIDLAAGISLAEMTDLAALLTTQTDSQQQVRAAIIAATPKQLIEILQKIKRILSDSPPAKGELTTSPTQDFWLANTVNRPDVAFVFPGQGSQRLNMARTLVERYDWAQQLVGQADKWLEEVSCQPVSPLIYRCLETAVGESEIINWFEELSRAEIASPAICLVSLLWLRYLQELGIEPVAVGGHSLGELTAFYQAGAFDAKTLIQFAAIRGRALANFGKETGAMASLGCDRASTDKILQQVSGYVVIANLNSTSQTVISGESDSIDAVIEIAESQEIQAKRLPVANAFHSEMVREAAKYVADRAPIPAKLTDIATPLFSSIDGEQVKLGVELSQHFSKQIVSAVDFVALTTNIYQHCDLILEVGYSRVLANLINTTINSKQPVGFCTEGKPTESKNLNCFLGRLFVANREINWQALYKNRLVHPFIPASDKLFIDNPCERPFKVPETYLSQLTPILTENQPQNSLDNLESSDKTMAANQHNFDEILSQYFSDRSSFLAEIIKADLATIPEQILDKSSNLTDEKLIPILSRYFQVRGSFLGQIINSDLKSLNYLDRLETRSPFQELELSNAIKSNLNYLNGNSNKHQQAKQHYIEEAVLLEPEIKHQAQAVNNLRSDIEQFLLNSVVEKTGYPLESIDLGLKLLDDLNLDSIKAGELIATATKKFGIAGQLQPSSLTNVTLKQIAEEIDRTISGDLKAVNNNPKTEIGALSKSNKTTSDIAPTKSTTSTLVRNFAIAYVEQKIPQRNKDWSQAKVLIVTEAANLIADAVAEQLGNLGARVDRITYEEVDANLTTVNYSDYLAFLPQRLSEKQNLLHESPLNPPILGDFKSISPQSWGAGGAKTRKNLAETTFPISSQTNGSLPLSLMVERLKSIVTTSKNSITPNIAYIQFGGGYFGQGKQAISPEVCCAAAFARSWHLERSDLRVRVIDLATEIEPSDAAQLAIAELAGNEAIVTVGYDADKRRSIPQPRLQQPVNYQKRGYSWSQKDVILVTGGAKGITAECALALAQSLNVKMAIVGRSDQSKVAQTLERFPKQDRIRYYTCDITDADAVDQLIATITADLGTVTGVIHGAGVNQPRRVESVSVEAAVKEVSPKLLGAYNLLQSLAATPPKLFMAFSSIIGVTGMPGNAWYGFSNESLAILLRQFNRHHPETQTLSLAYSVWGEVGMGARLGSLKNLERMGINAIPTKEGCDRFLKLFNYDPEVSQVIIAARLGGLDTWLPDFSPPTKLRFIESVLHLEPEVKLTARTHLSLERDLYLQDHLWRGSYLFPTVFGLEAMAQATAYVLAEEQPVIAAIEDISLKQPIVVDPSQGVTIEIHAEALEVNLQGERRVKVAIRSEQSNFTSDCFTATLVIKEAKAEAKIDLKLNRALELNPQIDLYSDLLFQGSRFQRMGDIYSLTSTKCVFQAETRSLDELIADSFAQEDSHLILGDPYLRDILLQSVQLTIPRDICLPVEIGKIELFNNASSRHNSKIVIANLQQREGDEYISEVIVTDESGIVLEKLTGYRLRILEEHPENPTAEELAFPETRDRQLLDRALKSITDKFNLNLPAVALGVTPSIHQVSKQQRRQQEKPIVAHALRTKLGLSPEAEMEFELESLASGKPQLTGAKTAELELSLSHCDRYCLCVIDKTPQGCDIEPITHRSAKDWQALLGNSQSEIVRELTQLGDRTDLASPRIWSANEAIAKVFNGIDAQFSIVNRDGDAVLLKCSTPTGKYYVVTFPIKLTCPPERMIAIAVTQPKTDSIPVVSAPLTDKAIDNRSHRSRYTRDNPQGQLVYEQRFQASFKDSGSISRHVYFSQYFRWIGKIREIPMESIAERILGDFLTGEWGMVTNTVSLRVVGEATAYDVIQARAWVGSIIDSSFTTYIEFCQVLPDESLTRLAIAEVKATWVRLVDYGVPSPMPFPDYLQEYLDQFATEQPATIDLQQPDSLPLPPLPASLRGVSLGHLLQQSSSQERYGQLIYSEVFQTTLEESNLVGNVYYGNYFIWQGRILDLFLYSIAPEYLRVSNPCGEMVCLYSRMDYLKEAMPFDKICVLLYVSSVFECGATFNFEFFREQPDGTREKLHVGQQEVAWVERQVNGTPVSAPLPPILRQKLLRTFSKE